jgi:hypothetical protein
MAVRFATMFSSVWQTAGTLSTGASVIALVWAAIKRPETRRLPPWAWLLLILGSALLALGNTGFVRNVFLLVTGGSIVVGIVIGGPQALESFRRFREPPRLAERDLAADVDWNQGSWSVYPVGIQSELHLDGPSPYITFRLDLINGGIYRTRLAPTIVGRVRVFNEALTFPPEYVQTDAQGVLHKLTGSPRQEDFELPRHRRLRLELRQNLVPPEAAELTKQPDDVLFHLDELRIGLVFSRQRPDGTEEQKTDNLHLQSFGVSIR